MTTFLATPLEIDDFDGVNVTGLLIMLNKLLTLIFSGRDWLWLGEPEGDRSRSELLWGVFKGEASNELLLSSLCGDCRTSHSANTGASLNCCIEADFLLIDLGGDAAFFGVGLSRLTAILTPCSVCDKGPRRRRMTTIISSSVRLFFSSISLTIDKHWGQDVLYCINFLMQTEQTRKDGCKLVNLKMHIIIR